MTTYLLYNRATPAERRTADLAQRLEAAGVEAELIDADSPRGVQLAEYYDVLARPAVILVREDGTPVQMWMGEDQLPSPGDVSYLAHQ